MKKRMKKVATLCLAGVTAMSTVGVTGSAVFAKYVRGRKSCIHS